MRRYAGRSHDFMGYPSEPQPAQRPNALDPKDERLIEQSEEIGFLKGQNDLLAEDNGRLEDDNRKLRDDNKTLKESNREYERREESAQAGYKSGQQLVDEVEEAIKKMKGKK